MPFLPNGEQKPVALARGLVPRPKLLILDELSLGLFLKLIGSVLDKIIEIN